MANTRITVIARIKAKAGMEKQVKQELLKLLSPTRSEVGCINYDMHQKLDDASLFLFHENWESEDDLQRHLSAAHIANWIKQAEVLLAEPIEITIWKPVA